MSRRAKIVCTLGPATSSQERITGLIIAGLDVARLNFSHGTQQDHAAVYERVRTGSSEVGRAVGVLADLQGPKIRLGTFPGGPVVLRPGEDFIITTEDIPGTEREASTTYQGLPGDVRVGDRILIDDGNVQLDVLKATGTRVFTRVAVGGKISNHKGINLPGVAVSAPALTPKDEADLRFALDLGVDMVAMSFVRSPDDVILARKIMEEDGIQVPIVAKIEKPEAVDDLPDIVDAFDGIMVARGDLGVEFRSSRCRRANPRDQPGQGACPAGDRRHPDAGVDPLPRPGPPGPRYQTSLARAQRAGADPRSCSPPRRGWARTRSRRSSTMARNFIVAAESNTLGAEHSPVPDPDHHRRRHRPRGGRGRRDRGGQGPGRVHDVRRDRTSPGHGTGLRSRCSPSPPSRPPAASSR